MKKCCRIPQSFIFMLCAALFAPIAAMVYYVDDVNGLDANTGRSETGAWQTMQKVHSTVLTPGDSVLFKRSGVWRGPLIPQSGTLWARNYYGAFGTGSKPVILGSASAATANAWVNAGANLWKSTVAYSLDVGSIYLSNGDSLTICSKKFVVDSLQRPYDFCWVGNYAYIYLDRNPADAFKIVELALGQNVVDLIHKSHLVFENLHARFGAWCGFRGDSTFYVTVRSCDMSYLGGKKMSTYNFARHGNGFTVYGSCGQITVDGCKIWEVYDSGISNQYHGTGTVYHEDLTYVNNIIWNTPMAGFELANTSSTGTFKRIRIENNTVAFRGQGWGARDGEHYWGDGTVRLQKDVMGANLTFTATTAVSAEISVRNNIFYGSDARLLWLYSDTPWYVGVLTMDYNCWFNVISGGFNLVNKKSYNYNQFAAYKLETGFDAHSVFADPLFLQAQQRNFTLRAESPCVNAGTAVNIAADYNGNPRQHGSSFDMGALEAGGTTSVRHAVEKAGYRNQESARSILMHSRNEHVANATLNRQVVLYSLEGKRIPLVGNSSNYGAKLPQSIYIYGRR